MSRPKLALITGEPQVTDAVRIHVRKTLEANQAYTDAVNDKIREIEQSGGRIVDGGSTGDGEWEITDWRTGERLAYGADDYDGYVETTERLDPDGKWWHIDQVHNKIPMWRVSPTDGVPESLAAALEEWATNGPSDEVAEFAGWSVDEVERAVD